MTEDKKESLVTGSYSCDLFLEIKGFEDSGILNGLMLREWLISMLPWPHIMRERVRWLVFIGSLKREDDNPNIIRRGECFPPHDGEGALINIYRLQDGLPLERSRSLMRHVVYHEISHVVYGSLRGKAQKHWLSLIDLSNPESSIVQSETMLNPQEEFAECYAHYIQQPNVLKDVSNEKYDFLRVEIFGNREYWDFMPSSTLY
ncbi:MAG: hypothetical protein HW384_627 [Dehalococcoidia bacterium]|nr:hypothetical protein [Dehalococcoidia bacterium]